MDYHRAWRTSCRFCGKLAESEECKECQEHFEKLVIIREKCNAIRRRVNPGL